MSERDEDDLSFSFSSSSLAPVAEEQSDSSTIQASFRMDIIQFSKVICLYGMPSDLNVSDCTVQRSFPGTNSMLFCKTLLFLSAVMAKG